ncbi:MAG: hypothetical protein HYU97_00050 [Deltaproteobacteria bacterium]|nr:hypothetical protein [Deltaproteobacteria bacterium]
MAVGGRVGGPRGPQGPKGEDPTKTDGAKPGRAGGKEAEEGRPVPEVRAGEKPGGATSGDAAAVVRASRGAGAFAWLAKLAAGLGMRRSPWSRDGLRVDRPGEVPGDTVAEAARGASADVRRFFQELPNVGQGEASFYIDPVRRGQAVVIGEGFMEPNQLVTLPPDEGSPEFAAGMLGPELGFVVRIKTGEGYFLRPNRSGEFSRLELEHITPGVNFPGLLDPEAHAIGRALIAVPTEEGLKLFLLDDWQAQNFAETGYPLNQPILLRPPDDLVVESAVQSFPASLELAAGVSLYFAHSYSTQLKPEGVLRLHINLPSDQTPLVNLNGYHLDQHVELYELNGLHRVQVGTKVFYVLADQNVVEGGSHLVMVLPMEETYLPLRGRGLSDAPLAPGQDWSDFPRHEAALTAALPEFADLANGVYTVNNGFLMVDIGMLRSYGRGEVRRLILFHQVANDFTNSPFPDGYLRSVRAQIRARGDRADDQDPIVTPLGRWGRRDEPLPHPQYAFSGLPDFAEIPRIELGQQIRLIETGARRVFDFAGTGVFLEIIAGNQALEAKLYVSPGAQAYVGREEGGHRVEIASPSSGRGMYQHYVVGSWEEIFLVEVGGVSYRITLDNESGDYFAEVELAD